MRKKWIPVVLLLALILSACNPSEQATFQPQEDEAFGNAATVAEDPTLNEDATEEPSPPPTEIPSPYTQPEEIIHSEFPGNFKQSPLQSIFDCTTGNYHNPGQEYTLSEVCDQWERNYFERPVDESTTKFFPQLDILESSFGQNENWYYNRILVFSELVENLVLDGIYALEIDLDLDARGEILILAVSPGSYQMDEWHSDGVQVWFDSNDDVGGPQAVLADTINGGDGYETLMVDSGVGDDPDLAFVKTYSDQPGLIEFGFKANLLDGVEIFEWWVWAMREDLGAAKFDPVDFFPQDTLFAIDNTCGWIYGSYSRDLPNICNPITGAKPGAASEAASPSCLSSIVKDNCADNGGVWEDYPYCQCVIS